MKQRKKPLRNGPSYTIPSSGGRWFNLVFLPMALVMLVFSVYYFVSMIEERVYGGLIAAVFVGVPASCWFGGFVIQSIRARGDYLRFTSNGIEMRLHPVFAFWKPTAIGIIYWSQIEKCGISEQRGGKGGPIYFLLLKLEGEKEVREYSLAYLSDRGPEAKEKLKLYAGKRMSRALGEDETKRLKYTGYVLMFSLCAVTLVCLSITPLYEHTIIASWFWAVVVGFCLLVAIPLRGISKLKSSAHYMLAVVVGVLLFWALLKVNYQFADRRTSVSEIRNYRVVRSGFHKAKNEAPRAYIRIDLGLETKEIEFTPGVAHRYLDAETIDLVVYPGALGFDVW